jgi:hypothetical protein
MVLYRPIETTRLIRSYVEVEIKPFPAVTRRHAGANAGEQFDTMIGNRSPFRETFNYFPNLRGPSAFRHTFNSAASSFLV